MKMFENFFIKNRCEKILDIGCGENTLPSLKAIRINIKPPADIIASAEALPFRTNSFDGALMHHVLEHLNHRNDAISELARVTKKSAIIEVPSKWDKDAYKDKDHKIFYTKEELENDLKKFYNKAKLQYCAFETNINYPLFRILSFIGKHVSAIIPSRRKYLRVYVKL
jgi:ubiquinone/menaquinone biosynthesis C-methylase UbiE